MHYFFDCYHMVQGVTRLIKGIFNVLTLPAYHFGAQVRIHITSTT